MADRRSPAPSGTVVKITQLFEDRCELHGIDRLREKEVDPGVFKRGAAPYRGGE